MGREEEKSIKFINEIFDRIPKIKNIRVDPLPIAAENMV